MSLFYIKKWRRKRLVPMSCNESLPFDSDENEMSPRNSFEIYSYLPDRHCCSVMRGRRRSAWALKSREMPPALSRRFDEGRPARARYVHHRRRAWGHRWNLYVAVREGG